MDIHSLLQIYQTYSLEKINALSKKSLAIQYAQNGELVKLNKQLAASNAATNSILRNQIKELERQEKVRFYKNLIFNMKQALDKIEKQPNVNFRMFLSSLFLKPIESYSKESISILEDINDKEYAQQLIDRAKAIELSNKEHELDYNQTAWPAFIPVNEAYENKQKQAAIRINKSKIEVLEKDKDSHYTGKGLYHGCLITSLIFLALMIWFVIDMYKTEGQAISDNIIGVIFALFAVGISLLLKRKGIKKRQRKNEETEQTITQLKNEISVLTTERKEIEDSYTRLYAAITNECSDWENQTKEILELLPHDVDESDKKKKYDSLIKEAARLIVTNQDGSPSLIQRKFAIGYNRANSIMDQLETLGIVGKADGAKPRVVLITSESLLDIIFETYEIK